MDGAEAVGEEARGHDTEHSEQAHEGIEGAGEGRGEALVLGEGDDVGGDEEVLEAADGVHHEEQPELAGCEDRLGGEGGGVGWWGCGGVRI